eukprot:c4626_g1_i1.p1 GENE.c4626_g1_i1~~c4626_g1_i1.p1  ORF type:complete len:389 (-),score=87.18 c4626_g1_i1:212-1378(-)
MTHPEHNIQDSFGKYVDLACDVFGTKVIFATDEFFANAALMFQKEPPVFINDKYTEFGKWMDGWESRRKRTEGHDWCIVKLGLPGLIRGFEVDTSFFTGNFAPAVSIQAIALDPAPTLSSGRSTDPECVTPGEMGSCATEAEFQAISALKSENWGEVLAMTPLQPGVPSTARHFFLPSQSQTARVTHIRVNIFPDGGVARLRVFGEVSRDWSSFPKDQSVDLASAINGASICSFSDAHFGKPSNLLGPGRAPNMGDGWETGRKKNRPFILQRGADNMIDFAGNSDWSVIKLATKGTVTNIEVDTNHFKGNFPESCTIDACVFEESDSAMDPDPHNEALWKPLLNRTKLQAHAQAYFQPVESAGPITHVRLTIYPDGGISRLRLNGVVA